MAPIPAKPAYELGELLAYRDRAFVANAYRAILRREPDPEGLVCHLSRLRQGAASKVEVLAALRWSPEGVSCGVHINGLLLPTLLQRWKRKRFVGPLLAWGHAFVRLPTIMSRLYLLEATAAHDVTLLAEHVDRQLDIHANQAHKLLDVAVEANRVLSGSLQGLEVRLTELGEQERGRVGAEHARETRLLALHAALETRFEEAKACLSERLDGMEFRVAACAESIERVAVEQRSALADFEQRTLVRDDTPGQLDALYVAFEEHFRGSPALIRERVKPYLEDVREAGVGTHATPVVDLGSGNGEWLGVLRESEFVARGIDNNAVFAALCRGRGLEVEHADAFEALHALPDGSVGAVTAMHLVEHLPFEILVRLLDEAMRVLCRGGLLILETPNPENLLVAAHYFYTDPTHRNPIPPETLQWLVQARGFQRVHIRRLTEARDMPVPPAVPDDAPGSETINSVVARLAVAPDYAIIARKL
ncbi:methyltransferase domain-containing protein [Cognatilysobacter bugurensis]|nr:methyltransferase domain-containing protein [Lysobacter bugurensis]